MLRLDEIEALSMLINRLNNTPKPSDSESSALNKVFSKQAFTTMFETGVSYGVASEGLPFLNLSEIEAKNYIKKIANNLQEQIKIANLLLDDWFKKGEYVAQGYFWRITVILRKNKESDLEAEFLRAWCLHFYSKLGTTEKKISERADKIGVAPNCLKPILHKHITLQEGMK